MCIAKKYVVKIWQPLKARIQSPKCLSEDALNANGFRYKLHDKSLSASQYRIVYFFSNFKHNKNQPMPSAQPLSNLQQELLKLYASNINEADLEHVRRYLAKYFANKAISEADNIWDKKGYTNQTMEQWLNEDDKPYKKDDTN